MDAFDNVFVALVLELPIVFEVTATMEDVPDVLLVVLDEDDDDREEDSEHDEITFCWPFGAVEDCCGLLLLLDGLFVLIE